MIVVGTTYLNGCNYQVGYDLLNQDTASNSSRVRFYGVLNVTNNYISWSRGTASVRNTSVGIGTYYSKGSYTLVTEETTIYHDSNGDFGETLSGSLSTSFVNGTASGYYSLSRILRNATITSAPDFTDEDNPTIKYSNPLGNNASSLQACISLTGAIDDIKYRDIPKTGNSYTFNLTNEERDVLRASIPNNNQRVVKFFIRTVIGTNTLYSFVDKNLIIVNANPAFTNFTFQDTNTKTLALTGDNQSIVSGYSNVKVTIPLVNRSIAQKKATSKKYRVTIGENNSKDITYSSTESVSTTLEKVTSGVINAYAIDSRGNSTLVTKQANNVINYKPIEKGNISVVRGTGGIGETVTLKYNGTFDNVNFGETKNSIKTATYKIQRTDSTVVKTGTTNIKPTISGKSYSFEGLIAGDTEELGFDVSSSYIITVVISDELSSTTFTSTLSSGRPNIALHKNGVSIMGKYDEDEGGLLQVAGRRLDYNLKTNGPAVKTGRRIDDKDEWVRRYGIDVSVDGVYSVGSGLKTDEIIITEINGTIISNSNNSFALDTTNFDAGYNYVLLRSTNNNLEVHAQSGNYKKAYINLYYIENKKGE